ncbi:MAG: dethiobiotin synthase [Candidatus Brocadiia bacterium]|jgi:dethiobiotin synthetase
MSAIFVAGTDTGVGKTVVTGLLARSLALRGYRVATQKWVQTGGASDLDAHLRWMGRSRSEFRGFLRAMVPVALAAPVSPHLAAELGGARITACRIRRAFLRLSQHFDFVIVEGTGGLMVPFSRKRLLVDLAQELDLPVLLVAGNRLGAINHTLLSLEALKARKMKLLGVVFNNFAGAGNARVLRDNPKVIESLSGQRALGALPRTRRPGTLIKRFAPIAEKVLAAYERLDHKRPEA